MEEGHWKARQGAVLRSGPEQQSHGRWRRQSRRLSHPLITPCRLEKRTSGNDPWTGTADRLQSLASCPVGGRDKSLDLLK